MLDWQTFLCNKIISYKSNDQYDKVLDKLLSLNTNVYTQLFENHINKCWGISMVKPSTDLDELRRDWTVAYENFQNKDYIKQLLKKAEYLEFQRYGGFTLTQMQSINNDNVWSDPKQIDVTHLYLDICKKYHQQLINWQFNSLTPHLIHIEAYLYSIVFANLHQKIEQSLQNKQFNVNLIQRLQQTAKYDFITKISVLRRIKFLKKFNDEVKTLSIKQEKHISTPNNNEMKTQAVLDNNNANNKQHQPQQQPTSNNKSNTKIEVTVLNIDNVPPAESNLKIPSLQPLTDNDPLDNSMNAAIMKKNDEISQKHKGKEALLIKDPHYTIHSQKGMVSVWEGDTVYKIECIGTYLKYVVKKVFVKQNNNEIFDVLITNKGGIDSIVKSNTIRADKVFGMLSSWM